LSLNLSEEFSINTPISSVDILSPKSKIANEWFQSGFGDALSTSDSSSNTVSETVSDTTYSDVIPTAESLIDVSTNKCYFLQMMK